MSTNADDLQKQMNKLTAKYKKLKADRIDQDIRYNQILTELNNLYFMADTFNLALNKKRRICYYNPHIKDIIYKFPDDVETVFITMVGGGGAGGIGFINEMYYYSGGGGGAGASIVYQVIQICPGTKAKINVGRGGCNNGEYYCQYDNCSNRCFSSSFSTSSSSSTKSYNCDCPSNGQASTVQIICPGQSICPGQRINIVAEGGKHGHPNINLFNYELDVSGGAGGVNLLCTSLSGGNGQDGVITYPSQLQTSGGDGGNSYFNQGGTGGGCEDECDSCYVDSSSSTSSNSQYYNITGCDGFYGSGGGGSIPLPKATLEKKINNEEKLCGNGGDGFIIIEF